MTNRCPGHKRPITRPQCPLGSCHTGGYFLRDNIVLPIRKPPNSIQKDGRENRAAFLSADSYVQIIV